MNKVSVGFDELDESEYNTLDVGPTGSVLGLYELYAYEWRKNVDPAELDENELEALRQMPEVGVSVAIIVDSEREQFNVAGGDITATGETGIDIIIEFPGDWASKNLQALQAELGNTVLHELEHITQIGELKGYDRGERYYDFARSDSVTSPYAKDYLLKPKEVPAHVMGYSDVSTSLVDLERRMRDDLSTHVSQGRLTGDEMDAVIYSWMDWAKRNLHQARFR